MEQKKTSNQIAKSIKQHTQAYPWNFTEGQPYILDECLSRKRPIIVFEDIAYIVKDRKGVFVSKRDIDSFVKNIKYIMHNYQEIQKNIEKNKFITKGDMLKQISDIVSLKNF